MDIRSFDYETLVFSLLVFALLITLCACNVDPFSTAQNSQQTNDNAYDRIQTEVFSYVESNIRETLKNPTSLIINKIDKRGTPITDNNCYYYIVDIDYSAQNGFGGYNREQTVYYVKYSMDGSNIHIISDVEYYNTTDKLLYKDFLSKFESSEKIPIALICTSSTYNDVATFLNTTNIDYTIYSDPQKEIKYPCRMFDFNGVVSITFNNNETISKISFSKYTGQYYYDANTKALVTIDDGVIVTEGDITKIKNTIDTSLQSYCIKGYEENYKNRNSIIWDLSDYLFIEINYEVFSENDVMPINIEFSNSINQHK